MLRIATRDSDLALWQARHVQALLADRLQVSSELLPFKTQGDLDQSSPLAALEGKGFFTKELENALLAREADLAVHSLKDLPTTLPPGLKLGALFSRADRREALLIRPEALAEREPLPLRPGARLGTSSARRMAQVGVLAPDLELVDIRGNVPTRVRKLREGNYDAILLAWAGLGRLELDLSGLEIVLLPPSKLLPAPGQGALAIEIRSDDAETERIVVQLDEWEVRRQVGAERGLLKLFAGGCKLPLGAYAETGEHVRLRAVYGARDPDGRYIGFRAEAEATDPADVAEVVFQDLLAQKLAWAENARPLTGKTVAITRPADKVGDLPEAIERMGGRLQPVPTLAFEPAGDALEVAAALNGLAQTDWLLFTSANAVHYFFQLLADRALPDHIEIGAVGRATAREVEDAGQKVALIGPQGTGGDLARLFLEQVGPGKRVLWPTAEVRREELPRLLEAAGVEIAPLVVYRSTLPPVEARLQPESVSPDWILVTSPQAGRNFITLYGAPEAAQWVAIGPSTQVELQKVLKTPVTVAREASLEALVEVLV